MEAKKLRYLQLRYTVKHKGLIKKLKYSRKNILAMPNVLTWLSGKVPPLIGNGALKVYDNGGGEMIPEL